MIAYVKGRLLKEGAEALVNPAKPSA